MSYASYSASVDASPFRLYSQTSFSSDLRIGQPDHFQFNLLQDKQQQHQKQHLQRQLCAKLSQESSQQMKCIRSRWYAALAALLLAVIVAVLLAFTPVGWPVLPHRHYSWTITQQPGKPAMALSSSTILCHVQQGSQSASLPCDDYDLQLSDSMQQDITIWRDAAAPGRLSQPGVATAAIGGLVDDGGNAGGWYAGYGRRRQQHRKLVRLS